MDSSQEKETEVIPMEERESPLPEEADVSAEEAAVDAAPAEERLPEGDFSPEEIEALHEELEATRAQAEEYLEGWQRAQAEFINYKKRIAREHEQMHRDAAARVIRKLLEISDDLDRALKERPREGAGAGWADGIDLIHRKLKAILETEGVERLDAEGEFFDPNLHEAISQEPNEAFESGQIIEVLQPGYRMGDRLLRPARVRVAA